MNNSPFPVEAQQILKNTRVGIKAEGLAADVALANLSGLGIQTIYIQEKKNQKRIFNKDFLLNRYPQLIYVEDQRTKELKKEYDLNSIIEVNKEIDPLSQSIEAIIQIDDLRKDAFKFHEKECKLSKLLKLESSKYNSGKSYNILTIGAGGIGNYFALGIKDSNHNVKLVDHDCFEKSNLNRQIFAELGENKAKVIEKYISNVTAETRKFDYDLINSFKKENYIPDLIIGCVDNFPTRNEIIRYARTIQKPYFDGGVDTSTGRINLNPEEFVIKDSAQVSESKSCARISNPSVVVPNAIIGIQLARCVGNYRSYNYNFDTLNPERITEEINGEYQ